MAAFKDRLIDTAGGVQVRHLNALAPEPVRRAWVQKPRILVSGLAILRLQ